MNALEIASAVLAVMLLVCLCPMPYGYFTIVRLAMAILAGCWAYKFFNDKQTAAGVISIGVLILFQPLVKIYLDRDTWNFIDIILAVLLILLVFFQQTQNRILIINLIVIAPD